MNILMFDRTSKRLNELKNNLFEAQSEIIEGFFSTSRADEALKIYQLHRPEIVIVNADLARSEDVINMVNEKDSEIVLYNKNAEMNISDSEFKNSKTYHIGNDPSSISAMLNSLVESRQIIKKEEKLNTPAKIAVTSLKKIHFIPVREIVMCKASRQYTEIILECGKMILSSKTLSYYQDLLGPELFLRVHRSHLINLNHVQEFNKQNDEVILSNCNHVKLSYNMKESFLEKMMKAG